MRHLAEDLYVDEYVGYLLPFGASFRIQHLPVDFLSVVDMSFVSCHMSVHWNSLSTNLPPVSCILLSGLGYLTSHVRANNLLIYFCFILVLLGTYTYLR